MKRFFGKLLCLTIASAFTLFWLYVFYLVLGFVQSDYISNHSPALARTATDIVYTILGIGLIGSIPVTTKNYRELKLLLLSNAPEKRLFNCPRVTQLLSLLPILVILVIVVLAVWMNDPRLLLGLLAIVAAMFTGTSAGTSSYPMMKLLS